MCPLPRLHPERAQLLCALFHCRQFTKLQEGPTSRNAHWRRKSLTCCGLLSPGGKKTIQGCWQSPERPLHKPRLPIISRLNPKDRQLKAAALWMTIQDVSRLQLVDLHYDWQHMRQQINTEHICLYMTEAVWNLIEAEKSCSRFITEDKLHSWL